MTGSFGPTINLATLESLPVGRMRANRRGCMTRPLFREIQQTDSQAILKIQFSYMVPENSWCGGHTERVSTSVDVRGNSRGESTTNSQSQRLRRANQRKAKVQRKTEPVCLIPDTRPFTKKSLFWCVIAIGMSSLRLSASRRISAILLLPECAAAGLSRCIRRPAPAPVFSWCGYGHARAKVPCSTTSMSH